MCISLFFRDFFLIFCVKESANIASRTDANGKLRRAQPSSPPVRSARARQSKLRSQPRQIVKSTRNNQKIRENTRNTNSGPIPILGFFNMFINIWLRGWIRIDFALLNTFVNCDVYRFSEILTFLGSPSHVCYVSGLPQALFCFLNDLFFCLMCMFLSKTDICYKY